jgi:hypothetical protein
MSDTYTCRGCDRTVPMLYSAGHGRFQCAECIDRVKAEREARAAMTPFQRWLREGYDAGWVGPVICHTHDSVPTSEAEDIAWETGDPCLSILRLYANADEKAGVEAHHLPSRRQP